MKIKTLIFCTYYGSNNQSYNSRLQRWIQGLNIFNGIHDGILIVDDAGPYIPDWDKKVYYEEEYPRVNNLPSSGIVYFRFSNNLGRSQNRYFFPGWYRSFGFALHYAISHNYEKIIHIESDAAITSSKAVNIINSCDAGWYALDFRNGVPESGIQIISGIESLRRAYLSFNDSYLQYADQYHETLLPIDGTIKGLIGDRYSEYYKFIPDDADFCMQVESARECSYYHWLSRKRKFHIIETLYPDQIIQNSSYGWSGKECDEDGEFIWMTGNVSDLCVSNFYKQKTDGFLIFYYRWYNVGFGGARVFVYQNDHCIFSNDLRNSDRRFGFDYECGIDALKIIHPDSLSNFAKNNSFSFRHGIVEDRRVLSVCVEKIELYGYDETSSTTY